MKKERDELLKQNEELREMRDSITPEIKATASTTQAEAPKPAKKSYEALVQEIIDNHLDLNHIYDCLDAITEDYPDIFREKYSELFQTLYKQRPLTLYALFGHHATRKYYVLNDDELKELGHEEKSKSTDEKLHFRDMLNKISQSTFLVAKFNIYSSTNDDIGDIQHPYLKVFVGLLNIILTAMPLES